MIRVLLRSSAVLLLVLLVLPFAWTTASGDRFVTVSSGSMVPTFQVGDVLSVQKPTGDELRKVGEIVVASLDLGSGQSQYVHRVDSLTDDGAWLRGDANSSRDPQPITREQVLGTPRFALSGVAARTFTYMQSFEGRLTVSALALALFIIPGQRRRPRPDAERVDTGSPREMQLLS
ncbi:S26 family signal peptidase [Microbacterium sp. Yaish 1]|uniref:S26 family signal peptidase n=1 Tax=Microbacterium sp. Yaish 1 TaxID=2025014 RepID=UPI000B9406C4|nr:S26 family signal peptidase [Microbacterium sp. Yaish 1]OYC98000.1 hypothetical protein CI089_05635 [Microbacterium sp. Yaish 1]